MTKMVKKIAAMGAAVMMMASISAMGASAYTDLEKNGAYCTAYKSSSSSVYASTSTKDGSKKTVGVNIVLYYKRAEIHLTQVAATAIQEALAQPAPHLPAERLKVRQ